MTDSLQYYTILTNKGLEYEANCLSTDSEFHITHIGVGDGNGSEITPSVNQTTLAHEIKRYAVFNEEIDTASGLYYVAIQIPASDGGFTIRELGGYNANGDLVMVAKFPPTEKRVQTTGDYRRTFIRMDLSIVNERTFPSVIDSSLSFPSTEFVNNKYNHLIELDGNNVKITGDQIIEDVKTFEETIVGNIDTADKLKTSRTILLSGAVTGSGSFDGSKNLIIETAGKTKTVFLTGAITGSATLNTGTNDIVSINANIGSSFNSDGISRLFKAMNADFTRAITKSLDTLYTAETDGFVQWRCDENDGARNLYINDVIVARVRAAASNDACGTAAFVPVAKGSTYKCDKKGTGTTTLTFYPLKGV